MLKLISGGSTIEAELNTDLTTELNNIEDLLNIKKKKKPLDQTANANLSSDILIPIEK